MLWSPDRRQAFRAALLDAYCRYNALKIFAGDALDRNLEEIISG